MQNYTNDRERRKTIIKYHERIKACLKINHLENCREREKFGFDAELLKFFIIFGKSFF